MLAGMHHVVRCGDVHKIPGAPRRMTRTYWTTKTSAQPTLEFRSVGRHTNTSFPKTCVTWHHFQAQTQTTTRGTFQTPHRNFRNNPQDHRGPTAKNSRIILKSTRNLRQNRAHSTLVEPLCRNVWTIHLGPGNWRCSGEKTKKWVVLDKSNSVFPGRWKPERGPGNPCLGTDGARFPTAVAVGLASWVWFPFSPRKIRAERKCNVRNLNVWNNSWVAQLGWGELMFHIGHMQWCTHVVPVRRVGITHCAHRHYQKRTCMRTGLDHTKMKIASVVGLQPLFFPGLATERNDEPTVRANHRLFWPKELTFINQRKRKTNQPGLDNQLTGDHAQPTNRHPNFRLCHGWLLAMAVPRTLQFLSSAISFRLVLNMGPCIMSR